MNPKCRQSKYLKWLAFIIRVLFFEQCGKQNEVYLVSQIVAKSERYTATQVWGEINTYRFFPTDTSIKTNNTLKN